MVQSLLPGSGGKLWAVLFRLLNSDWATVILRAWDLLRRIHAERAVGLYEVLDFEHTLELCDTQGKKAIYHKREKVRLLQDHVASYVDYAWGKGDIFADYQCSPGTPVDRYRRGHKHCVLISLREAKRRGDTLNISIDRTVRNGFAVTTGWSETTVQHRTHRLKLAIIFPAKRLPKSVTLLQVNQNRSVRLGPSNTEFLSRGRQRVTWQTTKPKLFETYTPYYPNTSPR
ncbi:hypothetical protein ACFLYO_00955 [Chloroflexota bacterium]